MRVEEIMTRDVITVGPETSIHGAARLMVDHAVSGLPVVDDSGALVGMLSEGDLILRQKPRARESWWRLFFADGERLAREYQKAVGTTVAEVMTRPVISVSPDLPIESAAAVLDRHRIRRVPVVSEGRLLGILSRGDLIKGLSQAPAPAPVAPSDARLIEEMRAQLLDHQVAVDSPRALQGPGHALDRRFLGLAPDQPPERQDTVLGLDHDAWVGNPRLAGDGDAVLVRRGVRAQRALPVKRAVSGAIAFGVGLTLLGGAAVTLGRPPYSGTGAPSSFLS
jgi:CBS domain-containing protein